ncbi:uncharacterized protein LOC142655545 isoform X2 [Rhinoderma darwinii]|uniref:uncharacterized protein LOC142655545 isoform X2 n=1 Tax=Rhinoderma darwinii TaxID=43563 RepID=UPI003F681F07
MITGPAENTGSLLTIKGSAISSQSPKAAHHCPNRNVMEPAPTGFDGSSRRNPPERSPSPLNSQDCSDENHNVPENHQSENLIDIKVEVKDEAEEETDLMAAQQCKEGETFIGCKRKNCLAGHVDTTPIISSHVNNLFRHCVFSTDGSSRRNPPERCPSPLYSQDFPEENHNVPENHPGEDLTSIKVEDEAEEERVRGDQPCKSEVEEEIPGGVTTGGRLLISCVPKGQSISPSDGSSRKNPPERCPSPLYSQDCPEEYYNVPGNHQGEDLTNIKVEDEEERVRGDLPCKSEVEDDVEERVKDDQPCKSEVEEEIPGGVTTGPAENTGSLLTIKGSAISSQSPKAAHHCTNRNVMEPAPTVFGNDGSSRRNRPERCHSPLYSQDCPEENHNVPENQPSENLIDIKVEVKDEAEEETDLMAAQQYGSSRRNPPERCPSPLYSQDCPEENHNVPGNYQGEDLTNIKVEDEVEEERVRGDKPCKSEVEEEIPGGVTTDGSSRRNPPERCPSPLYSQDCPEENHNVAENHQGEDLTNIKVEDEAEERVRGDQPCKSEVEEEIPGGVTTKNSCKNCEENFMSFLKYKVKDEDVMQQSSGENLTTFTVHPGHHSTDLSYNSPNHEEPSPDQSQIVTTTTAQKGGKSFQCGKPFTKSAGHFTCRVTHTGEKLYSCSECGKCFKYKSSLVKHHRIHTGLKPYLCLKCGKCFKDKSSLLRHERIHTGEKPYSCSECGKCFTNKSDLVKHGRSHTGEKPYSCLECGKCFTDKSSLIKHQRIHTGEKPYSCSECGKCFTDKSSLVKHQKTHTGGNPFSCSECGKYFKDKLSFDIHERSHTGEKPYLCSECGKCFIKKSNLITHQRIHTGEKPYTCSECGKCFTEKSNLVIHERIHTGEKPYSCSECGKCFTDKSNLVKHERSHTEKKPYSCPECEKCFKDKSSLVRHVRSHTGEKPYSCSECGKCFTDKTGLVKHQRSHTGEKPYPCSECGKCFKDKSSLVIHERSHTGEKPYSCSKCGKSFTQKTSLIKHVRSHTEEKPY